MFKLKKILNAKHNLPEYIQVPISLGVLFKGGCAITVKDGFARHLKKGEIPTHICAVGNGDKNPDYIIAYALTADMIFEADLVPGTDPAVSKNFDICLNDGIALSLSASKDGIAETVDYPDTGVTGKATVRFNI